MKTYRIHLTVFLCVSENQTSLEKRHCDDTGVLYTQNVQYYTVLYQPYLCDVTRREGGGVGLDDELGRPGWRGSGLGLGLHVMISV